MSTRYWLRRAYEAPTRNDGHRVLVDGLWPRGVSKADAHVDEWLRSVAPSTELRNWFGHDPARWDEFRQRYRAELADHEADIDHLVELGDRGRVTLVFGAKDERHNNAVALRELIEERRAER